ASRTRPQIHNSESGRFSTSIVARGENGDESGTISWPNENGRRLLHRGVGREIIGITKLTSLRTFQKLDRLGVVAVSLVERQVAVVDLQGQHAHRRRAEPPALPADEAAFGVPASFIRAGLLVLQFDQEIAHAALAGAVGLLRSFVPELPLVALEE